MRVQGSGFRVQGSGFRVQGSGFRAEPGRRGGVVHVASEDEIIVAPWFWVWGSGCTVQDPGLGAGGPGIRNES